MIVVGEEKITICNSSKKEIISTIIELIKILSEVSEGKAGDKYENSK